MKVRLLVDIVFEYGDVKKTKFKAGTIFNASPAYTWVFDRATRQMVEDKVDGYWIGTDAFAKTKCFVRECVVIE